MFIFMKLFNFIAVVLFFGCSVYGQTIHHELSMPEPETHYFHVKTTLTDFSEDKIVLTMPVWNPGSYLIREYSKNVNRVYAVDGKGNQLTVQKVRKNKWEVDKGNAKKVIVSYEVYAFNLTVRTAFLDKTHGFLNGTNAFTFPDGYKSLGGELTIVPAVAFKKISTPLPIKREGFSSDSGTTTFIFDDFDQLADSPIEIGNQETFSFDAAGVKHHVAIYGPGNYDVERLKVDMAKIVEAETAVFGQNPNKEYWFIIHNLVNGSGGIEHMNSTTLGVNRWTYSPEKYNDFLSVVAHEYFHIWNVKRLRPSSLVQYDYSNENYTDLLWVMEGFTTYYSKLILLRAGFYTEDEYLQHFKGSLNWIEGTPGNKVQSVSDASYDAWIKAYRPDENSRNTTVSYYSKGSLLAGIFDAMIVKNSNGKKSLDDFMQELYSKFYKKENIGITEASFKATLEKFVGKNMDDFFKKYIDGTETIPYGEIFKPLGLNIDRMDYSYVDMGMSLGMNGGKLVVNYVQPGSSAEEAGLSPNDEIIAFNGFRVDKNGLQNFFDLLNEGDKFNLIISRDKELMSIDAIMGSLKKTKYDFDYSGNKLGAYWLRIMD